MTSPDTCPLCISSEIQDYYEDKKRRYLQCERCDLVFVATEFLPDRLQEKAEYDLHENSFEDTGYRQFLNRAFMPVTEKQTPPASGLDFGCGPAPVLADMLTQAGFSMKWYDPIYANDKSVLSGRYDFITCTEAIEHFHRPVQEISLLTSLLKPDGLLVIMTKRVETPEKFANWHYKNDMTHVSFFSASTFDYIGREYGFSVTLYSKDVVLLKKHP